MMPPGDGDMMPVTLMPPTLETLFGTTDTSMRTTVGGVGRVVGSNAEVDGKGAVLLIISETAIGNLLDDPDNATTGTKLLDEDATITYADTPTIKEGTSAVNTENFPSGADDSSRTGVIYQPNEGDTGARGNTSVYIDDRAAVVLSDERGFTADMEFTMIGEPLSFSRMPTTMDFSGTYSGLAAVAADFGSGVGPLVNRNTFEMTVNSSGTITGFTADFDTDGSMAAMNIPIDITDGTFASDENSTVTFTADSGGSSASIIHGVRASTSGTFLGQFHGADAIGVTGAFHNSADAAATAPSVLGGFAGSKEPPPQ